MKHGKIHIGTMGYSRHVYVQYCKEAATSSFMDQDLAAELLKKYPELKKYFCKRCLFWFLKDYPETANRRK